MLSILIPTYNYDITHLVKTLEHQCLASDLDFEIVVLDDCSALSFREVNRTIAEKEHCRYLENQTNIGRTLSRKKLAEAAVFDTLLFLDADVMPVSDNFIKNYMSFIDYHGVFLGGIAYQEAKGDNDTILRRKYGRYREEKSASQRNRTPYRNILSGNILITKTIFLENNYPEMTNLYGMDNYLAYSLYKNRIPVMHIDNPVYHLGLEINKVFFEKCLESVRNRKKLMGEADGIEEINSLLGHYKKLKQFGFAPLAGALFRLSEKALKKMIMKKDPSLFCLDLYRLGYICSLK